MAPIVLGDGSLRWTGAYGTLVLRAHIGNFSFSRSHVICLISSRTALPPPTVQLMVLGDTSSHAPAAAAAAPTAAGDPTTQALNRIGGEIEAIKQDLEKIEPQIAEVCVCVCVCVHLVRLGCDLHDALGHGKGVAHANACTYWRCPHQGRATTCTCASHLIYWPSGLIVALCPVLFVTLHSQRKLY